MSKAKQPSTDMVEQMVVEEAKRVGVRASAVWNGIKIPKAVLVRGRVALRLSDAGYSNYGIAKRLGIDASSIHHYKRNRERWL